VTAPVPPPVTLADGWQRIDEKRNYFSSLQQQKMSVDGQKAAG
jgi:hypothetical protein